MSAGAEALHNIGWLPVCIYGHALDNGPPTGGHYRSRVVRIRPPGGNGFHSDMHQLRVSRVGRLWQLAKSIGVITL